MTVVAPVRLVRNGEGETVTDSAARAVRIVADDPSLAMTHSTYPSGECGVRVRTYRHRADAWWILDGALTFTCGVPGSMTEVEVEAGGFVLIPPMLPHAIENRGPREARSLTFHAPNGGFADHVRARGSDRRRGVADVGSRDSPTENDSPLASALILDPGAGNRLSFGADHQIVIKCGGADGMGSLILAESTIPAGFPAPVPHFHRQMLDAFWVLEGTLDVRLGDVWATVQVGDLALVPPGNIHTVANRSAAPVRVLNIAAPGGYERYLIEVAREVAGGSPDPSRMAEIASRYDFVAAT